ncbi:MAG: redoxin domain-containing protein, partial [Planctomycetota bacterium]
VPVGGYAGIPPVVDPLGAVDDFALLDQDGRLHRVSDYADRPAVAMLVQGNACPIVRNSLPAWRELRERFESRGVAFLMLNANPQDDRASVAEEAREFGIEVPVLLDDRQLVSRALDIGRTAEVLVFTPRDRKLAYRGPLDDRLGYETQKASATRAFLADALDALFDGRPVPAADLPARGCLISDADPARDAAGAPSYARDVAPILLAKCGVCHREGGIGPWSLSDHDTVRGWSAMMRETILTRRMPPWHADPHIGRFANDRSLSPAQSRTLLDWIDAGAPRGDGPDPLVEADTATPPPKWALGEPDLILPVPEQQLPATGLIEYRYADIEIPFDHDVWVVAADLQPGNPKVLHHGFAILDRPDRGRERWMEAILDKFTPGRQVQFFPEGSAVLVPKGSKFVMQLHYTSTGKPEVDRSELALYFADAPPEREYLGKYILDKRMVVPAGARDVSFEKTIVFEKDSLLHTLQPHMHYRGRSMTFEARYPDGSREMLLSVPDYRFNWQSQYTFEEPRLLPAGTKLIVTGTFDNSANNPDNPDPTVDVRWGLNSIDEMFVAYAYYTELDG